MKNNKQPKVRHQQVQEELPYDIDNDLSNDELDGTDLDDESEEDVNKD